MVGVSLHSTSASSVISDSVRDQILGKPRRRKTKPKSNPITPSPPKSSGRNSFSQDKDKIKEKDPSSYEFISYPSKDAEDNTVSLFVKEPSVSSDPAPLGEEDTKDISKHPSKTEGSPTEDPQLKREEEKYSISLNSDPEDNSMKKTNSGQLNKVTIGTQTSATDPIKPCTCEYKNPKFCDCKPPSACKNHHSDYVDKEVNFPEDTTDSVADPTTEPSRTNSIYYKHHRCKCKSQWSNCECQSTTGTDFSDNSEDSYSTDFFDLPYQNNEEYLKLLRELERKLVARNRERVRKTMLEFEKRSRQNQNLEKPVCDYNEDSASLLDRLAPQPPTGCNVCCKCGRNKKANPVNSDIMQNEKRWDEMNFVQSVIQTSDSDCNQNENSSRVERSLHKSHWQLDPRSGEWIKVSCFQQTDYARHPPPPHGDFFKKDYKNFSGPINTHKKECPCRQRKRR